MTGGLLSMLSEHVLAIPLKLLMGGEGGGGKSMTTMVGDRQLMETGQRSGNEELQHIYDPTGDAQVTVDPLEANEPLPGGVLPMATGGAFNMSDLSFSGTASDLQRKIMELVRARSPWAKQQTPVQLSSPGTNPYLAELGAAEAGTLGYDPRVFEYERRGLTPRGIPMGLIRRGA